MRAPHHFLLLALFFATPLAAVNPGEPVPDFNFSRSWNMPGGEKSLGQLRGKLVLVELWATW